MSSGNLKAAGPGANEPGQDEFVIFRPDGPENKNLVECLKRAIQVRQDVLGDSGSGQELKHVALVVDANNVLVERWSGPRQELDYGEFSKGIGANVKRVAEALTKAVRETDLNVEKIELVCVVDGPPGSATQDMSDDDANPLFGKNPEKLPREPPKPTDRVRDQLPNFGVHQTLATLAALAKDPSKLHGVTLQIISSCLEGDRLAHACAVELGAVAAISTDRDYLGFNVPRIFWPGDVHLAYAVPKTRPLVQTAITLLGTDFHAKGVSFPGHGPDPFYFRKQGVLNVDGDFVDCVREVAGDLDKIWNGRSMEGSPTGVGVLELLTESATRELIQTNHIAGLRRKQQEWLDACSEVERWKQQAVAPMWIDGAFFDFFSTDVGVTFSREEEGPGGFVEKGTANEGCVLAMADSVYKKHLGTPGRDAMLQHVAKGIAECTVHRASWEHLFLATGYVRQSIPMSGRTLKAEEENAVQDLWSSWQGVWAFMGHKESIIMVDRTDLAFPTGTVPIHSQYDISATIDIDQRLEAAKAVYLQLSGAGGAPLGEGGLFDKVWVENRAEDTTQPVHVRELDSMAVAAALVMGPHMRGAGEELAMLAGVFTCVREADVRAMSGEVWDATKRLLFCAVATTLARCSASARALGNDTPLIAVHKDAADDLAMLQRQQGALRNDFRKLVPELLKMLRISSVAPSYSSAKDGHAQAFCLVEVSVELCLHAMTAASIDMLPLFSKGLPVPKFVFARPLKAQPAAVPGKGQVAAGRGQTGGRQAKRTYGR